jgi:hypothetical protein
MKWNRQSHLVQLGLGHVPPTSLRFPSYFQFSTWRAIRTWLVRFGAQAGYGHSACAGKRKDRIRPRPVKVAPPCNSADCNPYHLPIEQDVRHRVLTAAVHGEYLVTESDEL